MKRPRKRLRMFSLLLASINIHYNVSLSERINSFTFNYPKLLPRRPRTFSPPGLSDLHPRDLHHLAIGDDALGCTDASPRSPDQAKRQSIAASDLPCSSSRSERLPGLGA